MFPPFSVDGSACVTPNGPGFSRRAGAGKSLYPKSNYKARMAADLRARSAVGCNPLLDGGFLTSKRQTSPLILAVSEASYFFLLEPHENRFKERGTTQQKQVFCR